VNFRGAKELTRGISNLERTLRLQMGKGEEGQGLETIVNMERKEMKFAGMPPPQPTPLPRSHLHAFKKEKKRGGGDPL